MKTVIIALITTYSVISNIFTSYGCDTIRTKDTCLIFKQNSREAASYLKSKFNNIHISVLNDSVLIFTMYEKNKLIETNKRYYIPKGNCYMEESSYYNYETYMKYFITLSIMINENYPCMDSFDLIYDDKKLKIIKILK